MKSFIALALAALSLSAASAAPRIVYTKSFPGSVPAYVKITVAEDGGATYQESLDDDPEAFKLDAASAGAVFELAGKLDHFKRTLESPLKVAKMGDKVYRWEDGAANIEVKYNYSADLDARSFQDWFDRITETERLLIDLRRTSRFDRLGVDEVLARMQGTWDKKRLVAGDQFLMLLDRIAKNESYLHMARERAAALADGIRGPKVAVTP